MQSTLVYTKAFDLAPAASAVTTNFEIDADLSHAKGLLIELKVTKAEDDADDTLDVKLQDTTDRIVWNTRARFATIAGNTAASAAAPVTRRIYLQQFGDLADTEEAYTPSGSAGQTEPTAPAVINGGFVGKFRDATGWLASWRFSLVKTDVAGADAEYEGTLKIWAITEP